MELQGSVHQEYFECIMENSGWDYPLNEKESFNVFQSFKQLEG